MPETAPIFPTLIGAFLSRLVGQEVTTDGLPDLRFPQVPGGALGPAISSDLRVRHWQDLLKEIPRLPDRTLLDFGCGNARGRGRIKALGYTWKGLDVPDSQESGAREDDTDVTLYDGLRVPFEDGAFHVVLSTQTFEHVADPHLTVSEIARILESGGFLVGSTSHIEPFHSDSTFTYTPALFADMLVQNGLVPLEISAGMDGMTLMTRRLARQFGAAEQAKVLNPFFTEASPLNQIIEETGTRQGVDPRRINALKLELVGQFHFLARKG
jgi:SAM-dependent methyltransferase